MQDFIQSQIDSLNLSAQNSEILSWLILGFVVGFLAMISNLVARKILLRVIHFAVAKTRTEWDDMLLRRHVFDRLSHLAPAIIFYFSAPAFGVAAAIIKKLSIVYMIVASIRVVDSFLNGLVDIAHTVRVLRDKPVKSYVQLINILVYITGFILVIAIIIDQSPWGLLSGLGAMTAVLLLVFKDSILGLVASVQNSAYDIVRTGDWITMPKYGVDGDVLDVSLNTVKVQNFDKTIVTIPTYTLTQDAIQNWRGMVEAGGRRIKRNIMIDINSIRFCNNELLDRLKKIQILETYIKNKSEEISNWNKENNIDTSFEGNGRKLTNVGCFRAYVGEYLRRHPKIHKDMTFLIRQLEPNEKGLPIQIYVFTNDINWVNYEGIQSDIFDHLLAILPQFDLKPFQWPTGISLGQVS